MLLRDRGESTKRDTKIIIKNDNGELVVVDWNSENNEKRTRRREWNPGAATLFKLDQPQDHDETRNSIERK